MAMWDDVRITLTAWFTSPDIPRRWLASDPISERKKVSKQATCVHREETEIPGQNLVCIPQALNHPTPRRRIRLTPYWLSSATMITQSDWLTVCQQHSHAPMRCKTTCLPGLFQAPSECSTSWIWSMTRRTAWTWAFLLYCRRVFWLRLCLASEFDDCWVIGWMEGGSDCLTSSWRRWFARSWKILAWCRNHWWDSESVLLAKLTHSWILRHIPMGGILLCAMGRMVRCDMTRVGSEGVLACCCWMDRMA